MKKLFNILFIVGVVFLVSCDDELELAPNDGLTDKELFSTADGFEIAIKGVYNAFKADGYYGEVIGYNISPEVMTDNVTLCIDGRQTRKSLHEFRNTAVDEEFWIYLRGYKIASRANRILDNIEGIPQNDFRNNIEGEALALRAMVHFDIARVHCKIPTQSADAGSSLGIYYSKSYDPSAINTRQGTTVTGVYAAIEADLLEASTLVDEDNGSGRLSKAAVFGLLSRFYLHEGDYAKVTQYADSSIARSVPVTPRASLEDVWYDEYEASVLFKILVTDQDNWRPGVPYSQADASGAIRSEYVCSFELYNLFSNADIRRSTSITTSVFSGNTYNHVKKFLGRRTGDKTVIDGKYLRMEEVYLNKAEAHYRLSEEGEALTAVDAVRDQRYSPAVAGGETGVALLDAILLERRLEFAFESDRFFTLKRLALGLNRTADGDYADGTGTPSVVLTYAADGFRWQAPIPQGAIDANPDLEQNSGY